MNNPEDLFTVETCVQYRRTNNFRWKEVGPGSGILPSRVHKADVVLQQMSIGDNGTRRWDDVTVVGISATDFAPVL